MNEQTLFDDTLDDILSNVRVYLSGKFSVPKTILADKLEDRGAITRSITKSAPTYLGLSKDTCVVIFGDSLNDNDKIKLRTLENDGYKIPIISEKDIIDILEGRKTTKFEKPIKNVDITYEFIFDKEFPKIAHFNFYEYTHPLGQKELYIHDIAGDKYLLDQSLGNIGAYSNYEFDPYTIDYCWLKRETIEKIKKGEKDEFIQIITDKYNSSDNKKFTYKFIIESEAIFWMEFRAKEIGDKLSLDYITRYQKSIYEKF